MTQHCSFFPALQNLNNVTLYGQEMRVSRSKHDNVNMPKSEDEGKELTKDYANSPLHRFKVSLQKSFLSYHVHAV